MINPKVLMTLLPVVDEGLAAHREGRAAVFKGR